MEILNTILELGQNYPNSIIASICVLGAAVLRAWEKRKLRKKGLLIDKK